MPRQKPSAPRRLNEVERQQENWNLGESSDNLANLIDDEVENYNSDEDADFDPDENSQMPSTSVKKSPRKKGKKFSSEMQLLFDSADFFVPISIENAGQIVSKIELELSEPIDEAPEKDFSVYFSKIPGMSFVLLSAEKSVKIGDIPEPMHNLLKAFAQKSVRFQKRKNLILALDSIEGLTLTLNVTIVEAHLFKFNHPSDVLAKMPNIVRRATEHFLKLEPSSDTLDEDVMDPEMEMMNQDIDQLYAVIKDFHEKHEVNDDIIDPQHKSLLPELRPYQKLAVKWMVSRELINDKDNGSPSLHPLFEEVSLNGEKYFYNRKGGFLTRDFQPALPVPTGGILADEMGLGKTVEVLSCMLCNPRLDLPKIEPLEVIDIKEETRKRRRRRRSPSPVEFNIFEDGKDMKHVSFSEEPDQVFMDEEPIEIVKDDLLSVEEEENISQMDGNDSNEEDDESTPDHDSDEDFEPRPSRNKKRCPKYAEQFSDDDDEEEVKVLKPQKSPKKVPKKSILKPTDLEQDPLFDPGSILGKKNVHAKSSLEDKILYAIIQSSDSGNMSSGVGVASIKKFLETKFETRMTDNKYKQFKAELLKLQCQGKILNTSGKRGCSGSVVINATYADFDSRGLLNNKKDLDSVDLVIEEVITEVCYEGRPYEKSITELRLEKAREERILAHKKKSLYEKVLPMYQLMLGSEVIKPNRKRFNGTFFDTKVEQADYFECICGSDLDQGEDKKFRVQCKACTQYQHAECVRYDVSDPFRGDYYCPHCWTLQEPVESGATLIVSPSSISYQWIEEIQKHIRHKNVKMFFYKGTKESGYIQPRNLANYDIVVTTYNVLQSETNYVDLPHNNSSEGRRFRHPKRFMAVPAPLPCVKWWRMVMDEAQMIECTTTKTAEMALRLQAVHRWCVTGTPIGKSLQDLFGLLVFLHIDPYYIDYWWKKCLFHPYVRGDTGGLERVLCQFMWRTAKKDVLDQINIPKQTEETHWLSFSPVEEHFYRRQHIDSSKEALLKLNKFPNPSLRLSEMDRKTMNSLLTPLLRLRQSCCHPQAVKGQFMSLHKSTMTMEQLMEQMIKKATLECEEANRQLIAALNGLAGLDIIEGQYAKAAEKYREALRTMDTYKDWIKTDTLQKLHTVTNMSELIEAEHEGIERTVRDSELRNEAKILQSKYLAKYTTALKAAKEAVTPVTKAVKDLQEEFQCQTWYAQAVDQVKGPADEEAILKLVWAEMAKFYDVVNDKEFKRIEEKYASSRMVLVKVSEKVEEIDQMRESVCKDLAKLDNSPPEAFLNKAVDCHLRLSSSSVRNKDKCKLCQVHDSIEIYESLIFHFVKGEIKAMKGQNVRETLTSEENEKLEKAGVFLMDEQRRGIWSESEAEGLLKAILKFAKALGIQDIIEDGNTHLKLFEAIKKEFRLMRIMWRQIYDNVAAVDELNMSVMRLRLRYDDEPYVSNQMMKRKKNQESSTSDLATRAKDKFETIYILEVHEIPSQRLKLVSDKTVAASEFKKKHGQLLYLENLQKSDFAKKGGGENPEPCPICQKALGQQWSVLQCGHCFCVDCIRILIDEYAVGSSRSVRCAICRSLTHHAEISYVNTQADEENDNDDETAYEAVKGSLSTKMEAVVKCLIKIITDDPEAKSLVFSTWNDVLDILASALAKNDIQFAALHSQGKFKRNLQKFRNRSDVKVLLMPISSGANGLNLIEASHVLLIEPILNPAQELQAIGRVHRIGQTKPTTVHRFLVRSTIEEKMHKMLRSYKLDEKDQSSHSTEENVLTIQDLSSLFVD